jgi:hypothetical protein
MATPGSRVQEARAASVRVDDRVLTIELDDGRSLAIPIDWYPRLARASAAERANWRPIAGGAGIHWPDLDEDISVQHLLEGRRSGESEASFRQWLDQRETRRASR